MNNLRITRVDNRYIHGQVSARLVRELNISKIVLISDIYALDPFMTELYQTMAIGFTVDVLSISEAIQKQKTGAWDAEPAVMFLFGTVDDANAAFRAGLKFFELMLANIPGGPGRVKINNSCYINAQEAQKLNELAKEGVAIYFQALTDMPKIALNEALKMLHVG